MQANVYKRMRVWNYRSGAPDRWNIRLIKISVSFNSIRSVMQFCDIEKNKSHQKYIERVALNRDNI